MKTTRISQIIALALLTMTGFTSCKKEAGTNPELSARVVGNYTLTGIVTGGKTYTVNAQTSGKMSAVRESATTVNVTVDVITSTSPANDVHFTATSVILQDASNGEVTLTKDSFTLGKGGNNTLSIKIAPTNGSAPFELIGTK